MKEKKKDIVSKDSIKKDGVNKPENEKRKLPIVRICIAVFLLIIIGGVIYVFTPYKASENVAAYFTENQEISVTKVGDDLIAVEAQEPIAGLIFYPGGRVTYDSYVPLMYELAERGVSCFIVKMPLNFAFNDIYAADEVKAMYPDIDRWYVGGHSLGGAMAAQYVSDRTEEYEGLMLLGAYTTADLSASNLRVFLAYGTQDGVINRGNYASGLKNLPAGSSELIIVGGCHSYFGDYGRQRGDGHPYISAEEQWDYTADAFVEYISSSVE